MRIGSTPPCLPLQRGGTHGPLTLVLSLIGMERGKVTSFSQSAYDLFFCRSVLLYTDQV
jgi:hypothetical protein